jgi:hypothetical protein
MFTLETAMDPPGLGRPAGRSQGLVISVDSLTILLKIAKYRGVHEGFGSRIGLVARFHSIVVILSAWFGLIAVGETVLSLAVEGTSGADSP